MQAGGDTHHRVVGNWSLKGAFCLDLGTVNSHNYVALSLSLAENDANEAADEEDKENKPEAAGEVRCYFYVLCWGMETRQMTYLLTL